MKRIIAIVILALASIGVCLFFVLNNTKGEPEKMQESIIEQRDILNDLPVEKEPVEEVYKSPIDFATLQELNPDIYAWLELPDVVSQPIANRPGDDSYYHRRAIDGSYSLAGSIYTEDYNTRDFTDPVTLIYGHNMNTDEMFSTLEKCYSDKEFFDSHLNFTIYMPECEKHYTVLAAVSYGNVHILDKYNFMIDSIFNRFMEDIMSTRGLNCNINENLTVTPQDHIVILSTCLRGNDAKRYLLVAVENK